MALSKKKARQLLDGIVEHSVGKLRNLTYHECEDVIEFAQEAVREYHHDLRPFLTYEYQPFSVAKAMHKPGDTAMRLRLKFNRRGMVTNITIDRLELRGRDNKPVMEFRLLLPTLSMNASRVDLIQMVVDMSGFSSGAVGAVPPSKKFI